MDTNRGVPDRDGAEALALHALIWALKDEVRAERLFQLTGLTPEDLRMRAGTTDVQVAVLAFLEGHEPDLIACARALETTPLTLVQTRMMLEGL
ncbi:DUF3572 family protein [Sphingomonas gilva]|uniref:DUF3572 family protein n=1 Tax=Sphingomonas gilva TaxID=2305907 RepID=A0A396RRV9_9SPHN|nr:DUF3572 family protein [Sphingomonas gilva]RHW19407.1 DUF3572 family protein [Sphingomonas gilva]